MPNREQLHDLNIVNSLDYGVDQTGTVTGESIQNTEYDAVLHAVNISAVSAATIPLALEESDDDSTWTSVAATEQITEPRAGDVLAVGVNKIAYVGGKKYSRLNLVAGAATFTGNAVAIRGLPSRLPVDDVVV